MSWTNFHGTMEADAVNFRTGTQSIKLTCDPAVDTFATMTKAINLNFNGNGHLRLLFYVSNAVTAGEKVTLRFGADAGYVKNFSYTIQQWNKGLHTGWNSVDIYPGEWTVAGGATWNDAMIRMQLTVEPQAGTTQIVSFDSCVSGLVGRPCLMIMFDDEYSSAYAEAFFFMKSRNVRGTMYVRSDNIGAYNYMTAAQIQEMAAAQWPAGNHGTVDNFTVLSQADVQTSLQTCKGVLDALGLTQNSSDVAYPQGGWNETVLAAMRAESMATGRTVAPMGCMIPGGDNELVIGCWSVHDVDTLASVKAYIDTFALYNRPIPLLFHEILPATISTYQWTVSDFCDLIDYGISKGLPFITIEDYKTLASQAITV